MASIPGLVALRERTGGGDPRITVAVIDGPPDLKHPCFQGADLRLLRAYWQEDSTTVDWLPGHATAISSIIFGQLGSEVEGVAPRCRGALLPCGTDIPSMLSELSLARAFDLITEANAQVLHCSWCQPNQSGTTQGVVVEALQRVLRQTLVVAPSGNNHGKCYCVPAVLEGVLAVGSLDENGEAAAFTNWGGSYRGVMAPGIQIPCAKPGGGVDRQDGTSVSAPIVSGVTALLLSLLLQEGRTPDPHRVREAVLETALACESPQLTPIDCPKCMAGILNIPGAVEMLLRPRPVAVLPPGQPPAGQARAEEGGRSRGQRQTHPGFHAQLDLLPGESRLRLRDRSAP